MMNFLDFQISNRSPWLNPATLTRYDCIFKYLDDTNLDKTLSFPNPTGERKKVWDLKNKNVLSNE